MSLSTITPFEAKRLMDDGAVLIDIREADEFARERIPGAKHYALSKLDEADFAVHHGRTLILHCRSGARTCANGLRIAGKLNGSCEAFILDGGLEAWRRKGLPTIVNRRQPVELQRQVQIGAGGLTLLGALLSAFVSPWFLLLPALIGSGLFVAGLTGRCGATRALRRAPWNQSSDPSLSPIRPS